MAQEPERRYQTCAEFVRAVELAVTDSARGQRRSGFPCPVPVPRRRITAIGAILVAVVAAMTIAVWPTAHRSDGAAPTTPPPTSTGQAVASSVRTGLLRCYWRTKVPIDTDFFLELPSETAVKKYQGSVKIAVDGKVGSDTWRHIAISCSQRGDCDYKYPHPLPLNYALNSSTVRRVGAQSPTPSGSAGRLRRRPSGRFGTVGAWRRYRSPHSPIRPVSMWDVAARSSDQSQLPGTIRSWTNCILSSTRCGRTNG